MKNKKESLVLGRMLKKIAPRIGATVFLEPNWNIAGQITFKSGKRSYFRYNTLDLNPVGASDIAKDKDYASTFMKRLGYPVVPHGKTFFSPEWAKAIGDTNHGMPEARMHACKIGFPVITKPNSGSQGSGVSLVHDDKELERALRAIWKKDRIAIVQSALRGKDYRIVVLDNKVISAYERIPLSVVGDGVSTIAQLLKYKQETFIAEKRDTQIKASDPRIKAKLAHQQKSFSTRPVQGERIFLLDNANLSTGGDSVDVTDTMHSEFKKIAVRLTKDMNLRLCGVDIMTDGSIENVPHKYWVIEINAAPGLDHYVKLGKPQEKIVEDLYMEVLKSLEKK